MKKIASFISLILVCMLVLGTVGCDSTAEPTEAPSTAVTEAPTMAVTEEPTENPAETEPQTETPTHSQETPTRPEEKPTDSTHKPTNPTELPTENSTEATNEYGNEVGDLCYSLNLDTYSGDTFNIASQRGKVVIINFWWTWCTPCVQEMPYFNRIAYEYQDYVTVVTVHSTLDIESGGAHIEENFPDTKMIYAKDFSINGVSDYYYNLLGGSVVYPRTVIVDADGIIVYSAEGSMTYENIKNIVDPVIEDHAPEDSTDIPPEQPTEQPTEVPEGYLEYTVAVKDEDGNPVSDVFIVICKEDFCFNPVRTDANGKCVVALEESIKYGVRIFRADGYIYDHEYVYFGESTSVVITVTREQPTEQLTQAPTEAPTETPANPIEPPTEAPTELPTEQPTQAPTEAPTETPANPIEPPTEAPTELPTQAPTEAPTEPPVNIEYGNQVGDYARPTDLISYSGETVNIAQTRGKVTVINFWGTWCYWCLVELPYFDQVASEYEDSVAIIAVHSSGDDEGKTYVDENFPDTKIIFANDPSDNDEYYTALGGVGYYPTTVILDENGVIAYTHVGAMSYEVLTTKIDEILAK